MSSSRSSLLLISIMLFLSLLQAPTFAIKKSYVVYLGAHSRGSEVTSFEVSRVTQSHYQLLESSLGSNEKAKEAIFYSYTKNINGFAANLEEEEAIEISKKPGVVSVFENKGRKLHTTRSWNFMGLERNGEIPIDSLWNKARFGEDIIIGNLDTAESFNDEGMSPVPTKWKGSCQNDTKVRVPYNKKLIGARYFYKGYEAYAGGPPTSSFSSARDKDGHGTHTLSTAGGRFVSGASIFGYGNGTAKGGSPKARVAAYKVCWPLGNRSECFDADIMAAFDTAIHDGVNVLSLSLSLGGDPNDYMSDGIAIGAFHAVRKGILVVCSAGNSGPSPGSVSNVAPWILTVGASTLDREFPSFVSLGNKKLKFKGQSLSPKLLPADKLYPLINAADAKDANATLDDAQKCYLGSLDPKKVKGKIVACLRGVNARVEKGLAVDLAGGAGMILVNDESTGNEIIADAHVLPATHITASDGLKLFSYINSTNLTAPGVSVLAAYSQATGPTGLAFDQRRVLFNVESGTSMSCPHISGIVGLLKTLYPDWSLSAIKSAIMTTAITRDNMKEPIFNASFVEASPFSYGSSHVYPNRAMDPGLVYDLTTKDYLNFLCNYGYNSTQIASLADEPYSCPSNTSITDFNYPTITVPHLSNRTIVTRTVKNVGSPGTYTVRARHPKGVSITVEPTSLKFDKIGEEKTYQVTLEPKSSVLNSEYVFGGLIWSDGVHYVRSPIVVSNIPSEVAAH